MAYAPGILEDTDIVQDDELPPLEELDSDANTASELVLLAVQFTCGSTEIQETLSSFERTLFGASNFLNIRDSVKLHGYTESLNGFVNADGQLSVLLGYTPDKVLTEQAFMESFMDAVSKIWELITTMIKEMYDGLKNLFIGFLNFESRIDDDAKQKMEKIRRLEEAAMSKALSTPPPKGFIPYKDFDRALNNVVRVIGDINNIDLRVLEKHVDDLIAGKNPGQIKLIDSKFLGSGYEERLASIGITFVAGSENTRTVYTSVFASTTPGKKLKDLMYNQASIEVIDDTCGKQLRGSTDRLYKLVPQLESLQKKLVQYKNSSKASDDAMRQMLIDVPSQLMAVVGLARRLLAVAGEYQAKRMELIDTVYMNADKE